MPAVSIIVPTRDRPQLVGRAIGSILAQTFTDFEIVVVDNNPVGSRIARRPDRFPWLADRRVRLVEDESPHNAASARNRGLAVARGEWVTYLDDDDGYHPTKLERQLCGANANQLPMGVCGMCYNVPGRRRLRIKSASEIRGDDLLLYFPGTPALFHRLTREVRFDESLDAGEDVFYFQCLLEHFRVGRVYNVPEALVEVYQQPGTHVNQNASAVWRACEVTLDRFGGAYSERARKVFRDRARLRFCTLEEGHFQEALQISLTLFRERGTRDSRLLLNCMLYKCVPWLRRWLVH